MIGTIKLNKNPKELTNKIILTIKMSNQSIKRFNHFTSFKNCKALKVNQNQFGNFSILKKRMRISR